MPPRFFSEDFEFENGLIPEHFETQHAAVEKRDSTKYWLENSVWVDQVTKEYYPLAIDIDDLETAELLEAARIRYLEKINPPKSRAERLDILGSVAIHVPERP